MDRIRSPRSKPLGACSSTDASNSSLPGVPWCRRRRLSDQQFSSTHSWMSSASRCHRDGLPSDLAQLRELTRGVESLPASHLRRRVVAQFGQLPHARVGLAPHVADPVGDVGDAAAASGRRARCRPPRTRAHDARAGRRRRPAGAGRPPRLPVTTGPMPFQPGASCVVAGRRCDSSEPVEDAQLGGVALRRHAAARRRGVRLLAEPEAGERLERVGGVAHPGEPVVPVLAAARGLGEGRGRPRRRWRPSVRRSAASGRGRCAGPRPPTARRRRTCATTAPSSDTCGRSRCRHCPDRGGAAARRGWPRS